MENSKAAQRQAHAQGHEAGGRTRRSQLVPAPKVALRAPAKFVVLPAFEGEMGVLSGHEPFWVELKAGEVRVTLGEGTKRYAVAGGFAEVLRDKVSVFAGTADMAEEINV